MTSNEQLIFPMDAKDYVIRGVNENDFPSFVQQNGDRLFAVVESLWREWNTNQGNSQTIQEEDFGNSAAPDMLQINEAYDEPEQVPVTATEVLTLLFEIDEQIDEDDTMSCIQQLDWEIIAKKMDKTTEECKQILNTQLKAIPPPHGTLIEVLKRVTVPKATIIEIIDLRRKNRKIKEFMSINAATIKFV